MGLPPRRLIVGRFVMGAAGAARFSPTLCCCSPSAFLLAAGSGCDAAPSSSAAGAAVSGAAGTGAGGLRNAKAMNSEEAVVSDGSQSLNAGWKCLHGFPASACKRQKHQSFDWSCEVYSAAWAGCFADPQMKAALECNSVAIAHQEQCHRATFVRGGSPGLAPRRRSGSGWAPGR